MHKLSRLVLAILAGGVGLALVTLMLVPPAQGLMGASRSAPGPVDLRPLSQRSVVYARDGSVLAVLHDEEYRVPVPLDQVPKHVMLAVLDIEDDRFYDHGAVDLRSTARALFANVEAGEIKEGGSTITQQLVKNAVLSPKQDVNRKVREAAISVRLEEQMTKDEILERYLNTVYFGNGAYGVQAAAERYFGTDASRVTPGQAALLAGMIRNPVGYDPFQFPDKARERRALVVDRMVELGHLQATEATPLKDEPLPPKPVDLAEPNDYFVEYVKQQLLDDKRLGDTPRDRYNAVFRGGLAIHTTLDPRYQQIAEDKVAEILPDTDGEFNAALVSVDPTNGAVRAMVGGPGFEQAKFNLVTDGVGRQPGSSFKVFGLVATLEKGYSPDDGISGSAPCAVPNPGGKPDPYLPGNYEGEGGGTGTLKQVTAKSLNCAFIRMSQETGLDAIIDVAHRMGVRSKLPKVPAMALGADEVHPLEMAVAFATLAADGMHHDPYVVESVDTLKGKNVFKAKAKGERVLSEQVARQAVQVLREVVSGGTGRRAAVNGHDIFGKTGTAEDYQDAWFDGASAHLATVVWMGSPLGEVPMKGVGGINVVGGSFPAQIWGAYMNEALAGLPNIGFPGPAPAPGGRLIGGGRLATGPVVVVPRGPQQPQQELPIEVVPRPRPVLPDRPTPREPRVRDR